MPLKLVERPTSPRPEFTFNPLSPSTSSDTVNTDVKPSTSPTAPPSVPPRPPADFLAERDMVMFGTYPLKGAGDLGRGVVRCKRCSKPVLEWVAADHQRICDHVLDGSPLTSTSKKMASKSQKGMKYKNEETKKRRASEVSDGSPSPTKKRTKLPALSDDDDDVIVVSSTGAKKMESKKMAKEREKAERRAAKERERLEIAERKRLRAGGPVNFDRQCGVINDKGLHCSRSLTCKTHTVGAKRAVEGRTRSYDSLYLDWQRANNPNFKEPASKRDKDSNSHTHHSKRGSVSGGGEGSAGGGGGHHGGEAKKSGNKKKRKNGFGFGFGFGFGGSFAGPGDDKALEDDEDGHKEMMDLVRAARIAGERCRYHIEHLGIGHNPGHGSMTATTTGTKKSSSKSRSNNNNNNINTDDPKPATTGPIVNGSTSTPNPTTTNADPTPLGNPNPNGSTRPSFSRGLSSNPNQLSSLNPHPSSSLRPATTTTILPYLPVWNPTTHYDQYKVGEFFTKALAARSKPSSSLHLPLPVPIPIPAAAQGPFPIVQQGLNPPPGGVGTAWANGEINRGPSLEGHRFLYAAQAA